MGHSETHDLNEQNFTTRDKVDISRKNASPEVTQSDTNLKLQGFTTIDTIRRTNPGVELHTK